MTCRPRAMTALSEVNIRSRMGAAPQKRRLMRAVTPKVTPRQTITPFLSRSYFRAPKFWLTKVVMDTPKAPETIQ